MDPVSLQSAVAGLKTAAEITRVLLGMKVTADVQAKVIELQSALLEAQQGALAATAAQYELTERIRELEAQLRVRADWSSIALRYALVNPWKGLSQVYALRRESAEGEPAHYCCTHCFNRGSRVMLTAGKRDGWVIMQCPSCHATVETGFRGVGPARYAEEFAIAG